MVVVMMMAVRPVIVVPPLTVLVRGSGGRAQCANSPDDEQNGNDNANDNASNGTRVQSAATRVVVIGRDHGYGRVWRVFGHHGDGCNGRVILASENTLDGPL